MKIITLLTPPTAEEVVIHLIREELKSQRFFEGLRELGLDDAFYQTDLLELIMTGVGMPVESMEHQAFCYNLLKRHSARVTQDASALIDEAKRVYCILVEHATCQ